MTVWRFRSKVLTFERPLVMGILNVTPDSFSDGGLYNTPSAALERALRMEAAGAAILDIGAQSTRPGAVSLSATEEWERLAPVLEAIIGRVQVPISIDTFEPFVATRALDAGADILNDVSGSLQNDFPTIAAKADAGLICMAHGASALPDVTAYFQTALSHTHRCGLPADHVCLDMGIGFHVDQQVDLTLIGRTAELAAAAEGRPLLCGASRKRVVAFAAGDCPPADRLGGSIALHLAAALAGAGLIRTHDVPETVQALAALHSLQQLSS